MILILSNPADVHARHVGDLLRRRGHEVAVVSRADFGNGACMSLFPGVGRGSLTIDGKMVDLDDVSAIWSRRPGRVQPAAAITNLLDRSFAEAEWTQTLDGLWSLTVAHTVNPLVAQRAATKPAQLAAAARVGLRVPETLITSDPAEVGEFADRFRHGIVHKAITSPQHQFIDTRVWSSSDAQSIEDLPLCPAVFQERIVGPADVRVTVVGPQMFAAMIHTDAGRAGVDSRLDLDAPCTVYELHHDVERALRLLMRELGLLFGTIDLKVADDGCHVFLEVNPQGQFMYVEIITGMPISESLADYLANGG
jgi:hypothetical protein